MKQKIRKQETVDTLSESGCRNNIDYVSTYQRDSPAYCKTFSSENYDDKWICCTHCYQMFRELCCSFKKLEHFVTFAFMIEAFIQFYNCKLLIFVFPCDDVNVNSESIWGIQEFKSVIDMPKLTSKMGVTLDTMFSDLMTGILCEWEHHWTHKN